MGLKRPGDVGSNKRVGSAAVGVHAELLLDAGEGGVLYQACCNLSAVFDRKQAKVAVALLEHEEVCLPYLLGGGTEVEPGICEARSGEGGIRAILSAVLLSLGGLEVGGNACAPQRVGGRHFLGGRRNFLGIGSSIYFSLTGATGIWQRCE